MAIPPFDGAITRRLASISPRAGRLLLYGSPVGSWIFTGVIWLITRPHTRNAACAWDALSADQQLTCGDSVRHAPTDTDPCMGS